MFICRINHKINPNRGGSYIDFTDWVKSKQKQNKKSHQQKRECMFPMRCDSRVKS